MNTVIIDKVKPDEEIKVSFKQVDTKNEETLTVEEKMNNKERINRFIEKHKKLLLKLAK